ncbi:MAG: phage portal protein family protein, partial [Solirubrobacterales bacterium]
FCKHMMEVEGVGISRDLTGIPVMGVPPELLVATPTEANRQTAEACREMVTQVHRNENEGLLIPRAYDANGNERFKLELLTTGGRRSFDVSSVIQRYEQRMLMCLLADFILLGHEQVGSFSLSSDKTDLFALAVAGWLRSILQTWNRFAIPRLLALNGIQAAPPMLVHRDIEKQSLAELGTFLVNAASAGIDLSDDDGSLSRHVREAASLPVPPVDDEEGGAIPVGKSAADILGTVRREVAAMKRELSEAA